MRTVVWLFSLVCPVLAHAADQSGQVEARTLEAAIRLAGPSVPGLPIELAAVPPDRASRGAEAWMIRRANGSAERIVVYRSSDVFRCASDTDRGDEHCLVKLASIIVHEAWHYGHGPSEREAYDAQINFLTIHGGTSAQITGVRIARDRILAAQRANRDRRR